jgi:hypothetical protein
LKSPINTIKPLVSWIEEDTGGKSRQHFEMIKSRVGRLLTLLSELSNYLIIGRDDGAPEAINMGNFVDH